LQRSKFGKKRRTDKKCQELWINYNNKISRELELEKRINWTDGNYIELKEISETEIERIYIRQIGEQSLLQLKEHCILNCIDYKMKDDLNWSICDFQQRKIYLQLLKTNRRSRIGKAKS
jgi:hypothetical protein